MTAFNRLADLLRDRGEPLQWRGGAYRTRGLCHGGDADDTVAFRPGQGGVLLHCHKCNGNAGFLAAIGWTAADLFDSRSTDTIGDRGAAAPERGDDSWLPCTRSGHAKVAEYRYLDADGILAHAVTRCDHKDFAQWRPDPEARSGRRWTLADAAGNRVPPLIPYRLPELLVAVAEERVVWIVEGEKDVENLRALGLPATCNAGGAGKWTPQHARHLAGADVTIVADRDEAGRRHAELVVDTLRGIARSAEVVQARAGKDASDHLAAGFGYWQFTTVWDAIPFPAVDLEDVFAR